VVFGEIGLSGEIRAVSQAQARLKEAAKLGFTGAWSPPRRKIGGRQGTGKAGLEVREIPHLQDLVRLFTEGQETKKPLMESHGSTSH